MKLTNRHNITTGKIYESVINKERRGDYLGKTVQILPHITNEIQDWIIDVAKVPVDNSNKQPEVCIIELGGTVGDIEGNLLIFKARILSLIFKIFEILRYAIYRSIQTTSLQGEK